MLLMLSQEHFTYVRLDDIMDELLRKYNEYMRLENCKAEYKLANG